MKLYQWMDGMGLIKRAAVLVCMLCPVAAQAATQQQMLQYYCGTVQAQSDVSRAANQAYGYITGAPDNVHQRRVQWVALGYDAAKVRFQHLTGIDFDSFESTLRSKGTGPLICNLDNKRWPPIPHA